MNGKLGLGLIVWWNLPDEISVPRSEWNTRFLAFPLPDEPVGDPLRRALFGLKAPAGTRRLVRPLPQKGHWALVLETPQPDTLRYRVEFLVKAGPTGLDFLRSPTGQITQDLQDNYRRELDVVTSGAVADLVLDTVRGQCLAVQARKTGGVYFIPQERQQVLDSVTDLVQRIGGSVYSFPISDQPTARDNLVQLVIEDLRGALATMQGNIDARHRTDAVAEGRAALDRVRYYREALGLAKEEAQRIEKNINKALVEALTPKKRGRAKKSKE